MPPEQLAELGLRRVTHSVRFFNLNGTLRIEEFDYLAVPTNLQSREWD